MKNYSLALLLTLASITSCKLLYAFAMIRHGALYPKKDFFASNITEKYKTELTPAGMRQLYNLGTYLRDDYAIKQKFLPQQFESSTIEFFSSSLQRTQLSATSLMYGLYPLQQGEKIPKNIPQQLLRPPFTPLATKSLRTQIKHDYFALKQGFQSLPLHPLDHILDSCINYNKLNQQRTQQIANQLNSFKNQEYLVISKMRLLFKLQPNQANIQTMADLYRGIQSDRFLGINPPKDYTKEDDQQLKYIYQKYSALFIEGKLGKILISLPFQLMREKLSEAAKKEIKKKMTFIVYHSSNMWPTMAHLNLTSSECIAQKKNGTLPPHKNCYAPYYGSSLIVELHENDHNHRLFIKIKFNGKYVNVCDQRRVCPLQQFLERVKATEQDYDKQCGPRPDKSYITVKK